MAKKDDTAVVRKAVFVPPALWQQVKVESAQRGVDLSDIITEMLQERYAGDNSPKSLRRPLTGANPA